MFPAVTCAIPGAKRPSQAEDNARAADLPPLTDVQMREARRIYDSYIRKLCASALVSLKTERTGILPVSIRGKPSHSDGSGRKPGPL